MSNIYLIRHAQQVEEFISTAEQAGGPPLAPVGIIQAEHLGDRLAATHEISADILYDMGSDTQINWNGISPKFTGGPGKRPVRIV